MRIRDETIVYIQNNDGHTYALICDLEDIEVLNKSSDALCNLLDDPRLNFKICHAVDMQKMLMAAIVEKESIREYGNSKRSNNLGS